MRYGDRVMPAFATTLCKECEGEVIREAVGGVTQYRCAECGWTDLLDRRG